MSRRQMKFYHFFDINMTYFKCLKNTLNLKITIFMCNLYNLYKVLQLTLIFFLLLYFVSSFKIDRLCFEGS